MQWLFAPLLALVALAWLCLRLKAAGTFDAIRDSVRKMSVFQRFAAAAFLAVFIVFASEKTNSPPMNLPGPILPPSVLVPVLPGLSPLSCGLPAPLPAEPFAAPPDGATTNVRWRVRGAFEDAVRIPFLGEDGFPWRGGVATALTAFACCEFRPDAATEYFPAPFVDPVSLPPLGRQDANAPSAFWHATTPSNSLVVTWENALHGRDAACPTNFQAEFFADGSFIYRYPDHATRYPPVLPFDWDGDGLENSVDPEPEVPGPDAHGTNAQWYNTVCSNILVAAEATNCVPPVSLAWKVGVNSNAYYFVDVVAERGPAPIRFMDANGAMPDDPVVVARAGEVCRVPLVIGVEYAVTSAVPFTVSHAYGCEIGRTPDYASIRIRAREGGGMTVHWPIRFSYVETTDETHFALDAYPGDLGLEYAWHVDGGTQPQPMPMLMSPFPRLLSGGGDGGCFQTDGSNVTMVCVGDCGCDGCTLGGNAYLMGHSFSLPTFQCGCEPDHQQVPDAESQSDPDPSRPSISVSYSAPAVIYEAAYVDTPGHTVPRRSTPVSFTISVSGGPRGGHYSVSMPGFGRVVLTEPVDIPVNGDLGSYETVCFSATCEGCAPSSSKDDVGISGVFVENETGCRFTSKGTRLTVFKVELRPQEPAPLNACVNRHTYGVYELVDCFHAPELETVEWRLVGGGATTNSPEGGVVNQEGGAVLRCPLTGNGKPLEVSYNGVTYSPLTSLQEPTNIVAETWTGYYPEGRDPAHAGDIGLRLDLYVYPKTVNFGNIALVEVPWSQGGSVTGYYALPEQATNRYHDTRHGAGRWHNVTNGNFWATDSAGCRSITNWCAGTKTWDIPIGWDVTTTKIAAEENPNTAKILGMFHQYFEIYSNGTVRVDKFGHWVSRSLSSNPNGPDDGVNLLDGNVFSPVAGNPSPSPQNHGGLILWTY